MLMNMCLMKITVIYFILFLYQYLHTCVTKTFFNLGDCNVCYCMKENARILSFFTLEHKYNNDQNNVKHCDEKKRLSAVMSGQ